ncbi:MAG: hypothetical protein M3Y68_00980 [Chloroflexota bacterium]|nr:hypothetical protein [Chloroflexota bacterium]
MKPENPTSNTSLQPGWQILGELALHAGSHADSLLDDWLMETVSPLDLSPDFLSNVLRSAQNARIRAGRDEIGTEPTHLRLFILAPARRQPEGCSWGFFRLEKVNGTLNQDSPVHIIEFYLYPDR